MGRKDNFQSPNTLRTVAILLNAVEKDMYVLSPLDLIIFF